MGAISNHKRSFGGIEKKVKEELGTRCFEVDAFGYLVEHLEGQAWLDF